jgi:hypothetical protein
MTSAVCRLRVLERVAAQQELRLHEDEIERIAQLVREHREELVLLPVELLDLAAARALLHEEALALRQGLLLLRSGRVRPSRNRRTCRR